MKNFILLVIVLFAVNLSFAQYAQFDLLANSTENNSLTTSEDRIGANGFAFTTLDAGINTKYLEYGSGFFMDKFIMVSSKKLGGLAKTDKVTGEGYKNIFCLDVRADGSLKLPLLFSRIINTFENNEDQLTFSPDEQTMYFTRSTPEDSSIYNLYKVNLEKDSHGNWIGQQLLDVNVAHASIENPFVSPDGKQLFFSSNKPGGFGGFDLYVANIKSDGTLDIPVNLGAKINTALDDKYPAISEDGKDLYFSSKGHDNIGGFDVFKSKIITNGYRRPRNLGNTINTKYDEVAYFMAGRNKGYVSSNKAFGKGNFDIYKFSNEEVLQSIEGVIVDLDSKILLPNTTVVLLNEEDEEIARQTTGENATYKFNVTPFDTYTITTMKDGFNNGTFDFIANIGENITYTKDLELNAIEAEIAEVKNKKMIVVNNLYFDYNKWRVKEESLVQLNSIARILLEHTDMKIEINAHTDNQGNSRYNMNLSQKRAAAAKGYLIKKGIAASRLISKGYGETQPLVDCRSSCNQDEFQKNRRIEFIIIE
ncbi:OmpA family protein [Lacinutrix sp. Hel_I_90]|uniref:OmpA family protein n=1 Tax=Lacinutrix sp. Hel_I_90 TaxID=1249999 RepID=UPI0005C90B55|nr:OmpA family protein [Lacinutrix sp. Hel_I_90]